MGRQFVIGDIHGAYRALIQCMERSSFDRLSDELICLGDVCDGWPETRRCVDELLRVERLVYIMGNHDSWLLKWMKTGQIENIWYVQGGEASIMSYAGSPVPSTHIQLFENARSYHLSGNKLFVHAGIMPDVPLEDQRDDIFLWDRTLARKALNRLQKGGDGNFTSYEEIYIGHTPINTGRPVNSGEVWLMDTGAGWDGQLSMMDINSKEVFISDKVPDLYPGVKGRSRW